MACAVCRSQNRRCSPDCIFAPYFPPSNEFQFQTVRKVFGFRNVAKMIGDLSQFQRDEAMKCIIYEAETRALDPVGGSFAIVNHLKQSIRETETHLILIRHQLAVCRARQYQPQFFDFLQEDVNIAHDHHQATHTNSLSLHQEPHQEPQPMDADHLLQQPSQADDIGQSSQRNDQTLQFMPREKLDLSEEAIYNAIVKAREDCDPSSHVSQPRKF